MVRVNWLLVLAGGALAACASVLGIDDTTDDPLAPSAEDGGALDDASPDADVELVPDLNLKSDGGADPGSDPVIDGGPDADAALPPPACDLTKPFGGIKALAVNTSAYETGGRLSADELTIWFARRSTANSTDGDIYTAKRADVASAFGGASKVSELNSSSADGYMTTAQGDLLGFFVTLRSGAGDIYKTTRANTTAAWGAPTKATGVNSTSLDDDVFVLPDGRALYFDSKRAGDLDIYRASIDGAGDPAAAVAVGGINTGAAETEPVVTLDDRTIYFARAVSTLRKIYVARRASATSPWGAAAAVSELNTSSGDESPTWVSPDGCRIVFSSERSGGAGLRDVYYAEKAK